MRQSFNPIIFIIVVTFLSFNQSLAMRSVDIGPVRDPGGRVEPAIVKTGIATGGLFVKAAHALIGVYAFCFWGIEAIL